MREDPRWELLVQPECELCEELLELLAADGRVSAALTITELAARPDLQARYLYHVPVLLYAGREIVMGRVSASELAAALDAILGRAQVCGLNQT